MRTTIDIPLALLTQAKEASGRKTKKDVVCWALEEATRQKALEDLRALRGKVTFAITPKQLEEKEIRGQRKRRALMGGDR